MGWIRAAWPEDKSLDLAECKAKGSSNAPETGRKVTSRDSEAARICKRPSLKEGGRQR